MKTEEYNKGHSFRVTHAAYSHLCHTVSNIPGVIFTQKQRFFWSGASVRAEFAFQNHTFEIETDQWDGALSVISKDKQKHEAEMQELRDAVEKYSVSSGAIIGFFRRIISETFT